MAQVSYGTITITDTNDIESIVVEYARNQSTSTPPDPETGGWSTTRPAWAQGYYIWQRTRIHKSGTQASADTFGAAVCLTGSTGQTGGTGAAGRSLTGTTTQYTTAASNVTITQNNMGSYTWSNNVPAYSSSTPAYWVRVTNTYSNPSSTEYIIYKDQGLTDAVKTSYDANTTAQAASDKADDAWDKADNAEDIAQQASDDVGALTTTYNTFINTKAKYFVHNSSGSIVIASREGESSPVAFDENTVSTYGYNTLNAPSYIALRYNSTELAKLSTGALIFYKPNTTNKGMELTSTALTFYNPSTNNAQLIIGANGVLQSGNYVYTSGTYSDSGTKIDLTNGSIYTPGFRTDGSNTYIRGEINALTGKIGNNSSNYWTIGNYYNYDQTASAALISHGTAFIQLDTSNTWRLSTDRIHTAWNGTDGSAALVFPKDGNTYWDWGMHSPHKTNNTWKDKFIYARKYTNTSDSDFTNRDNLSNDLDDDLGYWTYQFYVDKNGSIYARNFYLLNEDGTPGSNIGGQDAVYLLKSGGTISGNLEVNGTLTKGSKNVAYLSTTPTSGQVLVADGTAGGIKTSGYTIAKSVPSNAIFTDENVNTAQANTTQIYLTGTSTAGSSTGKLKFDSNVYLTTTAGTLHATTFEGSLSGTASRATADGDGNRISTTYLKLSGGNVTGAVSFGSSVSADELTVGDLVVNGAASFTNNLQANTINGVEVGASPKFTDTVTTVTTSGNGNAVTAITASNGKLTVTKGTTFLTSYTETDPIFVASAAHGITSSDISNWNSKTSNTGTVTSVAASGSGGISISGSPITTNGTITIGLNLSTAINGLGEGTSPANRDDYIVAQYASGGTTTTTYHRRKLSNIFAALNKSDITTALGYTPPTQDTNTHYTTHLYVNNNTTTNQNTTTALTNGNVYLHLYDDSTKRDSHKISGSGTVSVTSDTSGNIVITGSAHPTSLKNPNALLVKIYNGTSSSTNTNYDGSTANQSVSVAGTNAITGINSTTDGKLQLTLADGSQPEPISVKITATTSDSAASADKLNLSANVGSLTQPVYFNANTGLPVATTYSLNKTVPSDAKFTDTWIAMVGATSSANGTAGYVSAPPKEGYNTKFLRADGTWVVPGGTYSLPLAANGTRGGVQIGYSGSGKNYAVQLSNEKMYVNVPWTDTTYSAGTGLSLTGTTFTNTGVTGVKGNAESTYRTGQVNLTAANVGAVATSGNETVSGNKTFSGTTSLTAGSTYPAQMGTVIPANSSAIIQSPVPKYLWHDLWAFCRATTPTYYTTTDGTNWTQGTLDKRLFGHANAWGVSNVISNTISGSRWVWHGGGFAYCSGAWLALGVAYSDKIAKFDLKLEGTSDATATSPTWTELCSVTNASYNQTPIWIKTNGPSVNDVRLTITRASGEATTTMLPLCSIMWLSSRWGNQGKGEEYEHPYSWDSNYNIYPLSGAKFVGDVTGNASGTASNVTGTVAIDHGGTGATSAQNATWNLLHVSDPGDLNNAKRGGSFKISNTTTNTPVNDMWGATINVTDDSAGGNTGTSGSTWQIVLQSGNNNMWLRCITNANSWTDYAKFYTTANKPTKSDIGLSNVENKSSATIRGELTLSNVTTALGYTPVNKAGDTMTGALNTANGTANKIGDDSQLGDFNVGGTLGIQGLNSTTGVALLQKGTTWGSSGNYAHITYDGTYVNINKLFKVSASGNTVTIGSQNASFTHIYNSLSIPFIFNNSILTTSGSLGNNTYPFTNVNINGAYNMIASGVQKAAMHYDSTLEAIVFSFGTI